MEQDFGCVSLSSKALVLDIQKTEIPRTEGCLPENTFAARGAVVEVERGEIFQDE